MLCPKINSLKWGAIEVDGIFYHDVKIYPDRAETWDWAKTNTHHDPGIQPQDVQNLINCGCSMIILSQGMHRRLNVDFDTYKLLLSVEVDFLVTDTITAIIKYKNSVNEGYLVGALLHAKD